MVASIAISIGVARADVVVLDGRVVQGQAMPNQIADEPAGAEPTTHPAAGRTPASLPSARHTEAELLAALGSPDPAIRDDARSELMLLTRDELPRLLKAVRERSGRLSPQQA